MALPNRLSMSILWSFSTSSERSLADETLLQRGEVNLEEEVVLEARLLLPKALPASEMWIPPSESTTGGTASSYSGCCGSYAFDSGGETSLAEELLPEMMSSYSDWKSRMIEGRKVVDGADVVEPKG